MSIDKTNPPILANHRPEDALTDQQAQAKVEEFKRMASQGLGFYSQESGVFEVTSGIWRF